MSSYVETLSLTELKIRKSFLQNQLNIVNNLIENYDKDEKLENTEQDYTLNDNLDIKKENNKIKIKIRNLGKNK